MFKDAMEFDFSVLTICLLLFFVVDIIGNNNNPL